VDTQNKLYDTGELNTDIGYCIQIKGSDNGKYQSIIRLYI